MDVGGYVRGVFCPYTIGTKWLNVNFSSCLITLRNRNTASWYKYLIVSLVFSHLGFWSGNLFLIAPFPDLCLLVPFPCSIERSYRFQND